MAGMWARLQADVNCNLRRGAWYRLLKMDGLAAVVDVNHKPVPVVRAFVQVANSPPRRWTVVLTPRTTRPLPPSVGTQYAVCPSCRDRAPIKGHPDRMECRRCHVEFAVAWDERYLAKPQ